MSSKFYKNAQLQGAPLQQAQRPTYSGVDNAARQKAQQASRQIDLIASGAKAVVSGFQNYNANIERKRDIEANEQRNLYFQEMEKEMLEIEDIDSLDKDALTERMTDIKERFMDKYKDSPYESNLSRQLDQVDTRILSKMIGYRDSLHSRKVQDGIAESASSYSKMLMSGDIDAEEYLNLIDKSIEDGTIAGQVPSSSELPLDEDQREKYRSLTRVQAREAVMKGIMTKAATAENTQLAELLDSKEFRDRFGVGEVDNEYNKTVNLARRTGMKAEEASYMRRVDNFKEAIYTQLNQGIAVDVNNLFDNADLQFRPEDEYKLRNQFGKKNKDIELSSSYQQGLDNGFDVSKGATKKERQAMYEGMFKDVFETGGYAPSIDTFLSQMVEDQNTEDKPITNTFRKYASRGMEFPEKFVEQFDLPLSSELRNQHQVEKAALAINSMDSSLADTGRTAADMLGIERVSRIRGMQRIFEDENLSDEDKRKQIETLSNSMSNLDVHGYVKAVDGYKVDTEWLTGVASDANWTPDNYVSVEENAREIKHYYNLKRLEGLSDTQAREAAVEHFEVNNRAFEMPNGGEIIIPKKHKLITEDSITAYANTLDTYREVKKRQSFLSSDNWFDDWTEDRKLNIRKSIGFGSNQTYNLYSDDVLIDTFSYEDFSNIVSDPSIIGNDAYEAITGERDREQQIQESLAERRRKIEEE